METCVEALSKVIDKITSKEILLPDFQRKFVWKEEEKQAKLVASVLAKMPVGSILLLKSDSKDYAYKQIGCKERKTSQELDITGEIKALLDGQQRVTVLTNAFSNVVFDMAGKPSNLINQNALKRRFFLRIPKYSTSDGAVADLFNARGLDLPWKDAEKDEPNFLADEIYEAIKIINFTKDGAECFNPFKNPQSPKSELVNYCSAGDEYLVPLYLLTGNNDAWLNQILTRIADNIQLEILSKYDSLEQDEKEPFVKSIITEDIQEFAADKDRMAERDDFQDLLKEQGNMWVGNLKSYLMSCLNRIQLNQLIVDNHNRARAINIYENLNKGGVSLGTFELIMAKFASVSNENYYDKLVGYIKSPRNYEDVVYSANLSNDEKVKSYINSNKYTATLTLGCLDKINEEISGAYIEAYLDVISLFAYCQDFDPDKLNISLIKREKILAISAEDLRDRCEEVCDALDQALFFMQMRCGIRNVKDINYKLMLVVVAYILLNSKYRSEKRTYDLLEAWYWISIFSGYFNTDQTERTIASIRYLIEILEKGDIAWLKGLYDQIFKASYFTEKEFLLLKKPDDTGIYPKEFLRDVICQFFLIQNYKGLIEKNVPINPFTEERLEKHHVIPLGSLKYPDEKIKNSEDKLRSKKDYFLNSPVNFVYITAAENLAISDDKLSDYAPRIKNYASKSVLGLNGDFDTSSEASCRKILSQRYDELVGKVQQHINILIPSLS
ncbi:Protein of unknown function DUF262 [Anaerovibrio lipolyticus DSM 3074]|uniref:GmrSD restriction endonucleases N-terminal domain-containing protein n=1 Tax=Anaerovibrio lipolyticus DSM 3074 TaxID=1120997 RepID=A0A1M6BW90_9FIRM|nr:DUF262 domain-containing protein [Anaerovibrio lipolyticus]SHI53020.1 Protein of unknown function DUF262 [Anaerovibrio lipolyticus DSM 3074]